MRLTDAAATLYSNGADIEATLDPLSRHMNATRSRRMMRLATALAGLWAMTVSSPQASAAESAWAENDYGAVRLIAASEAVGDVRTVQVGLQFRIAPGWKIYWRSPGDAGYPPRIDWGESTNVASAAISWPAPQRFEVLGFQTLGYHDAVVLPIAVQTAEANVPVGLRAAIDYLTCSEICVPVAAKIALDLPSGPALPSDHAHLIGRYMSQIPGPLAAAGLTIGAIEIADEGSEPVLRVAAEAAEPFETPDVFVEGPPELAFDPPRVRTAEGGRSAVFEVRVVGLEAGVGTLAGTPVTLTLVDGARAAEYPGVVTGAAGNGSTAVSLATSRPTAEEPPALVWILAVALLGGLILNLMPCVLPVLSIKLLGVIGHGGGETRSVRLSFIASAAGIIASFLVLAGALAALKATGAAVGWGLQFQQPWFLVAMTLVMVVFAANLWGLFEFQLPGVLADVGAASGHVHGMGGHFLTGALATLLATPCSAPFVGTAIGFALARGTGEIFVVFAFLGLGLALPYLAVAAVPRMATMLPRPGPWMVWLRRILGIALAGTGVWLLSVLAVQTGADAALAIGALAAAMVAVLFLGRRLPARVGRFAAPVAAVLAVATFLVSPRPGGDGAAVHGTWVPFDEPAIVAHVEAGRVVFVNVTAEWCITCRVNEKLVLAANPVRERLAADGVIAMQGDWTRPDEDIARYLAGFGRYGIPFDAVYGPGIPRGEPLPELLSADAVTAALDRAAGASN